MQLSEFEDVTDPPINVVVGEFLNNSIPDPIELDERQKAVNEGRDRSRLPQVDSDDDLVVASLIAALLRRFPQFKCCLCTHR